MDFPMPLLRKVRACAGWQRAQTSSPANPCSANTMMAATAEQSRSMTRQHIDGPIYALSVLYTRAFTSPLSYLPIHRVASVKQAIQRNQGDILLLARRAKRERPFPRLDPGIES